MCDAGAAITASHPPRYKLVVVVNRVVMVNVFIRFHLVVFIKPVREHIHAFVPKFRCRHQ